MKRKAAYMLIGAMALLSSCGRDSAFIKSSPMVDAAFQSRKAELTGTPYLRVFADSASWDQDQLNAMKFLYAYMPLPDVTDYAGEYFKKNVDLALQARAEMPWGKSVPEREFLHFVLPIRVNNENLDNHREIFYPELKERVAGMSMADAILEVNHWCHERVTYEPSDSRTHSPLATVSSGIGRCGEESTFTVAALRSIGIPARQVYTPRWAHTDDNHAWVEAWADGQWYFLGACEPEPVLNLGWFNDPASRGMLMNTRAIGNYDGPEEKLLETPMYTDINVTNNYADVDTLTIKVVDQQGNPVDYADVEFRLYNYAEFYPLATKETDDAGQASIVAGKGDLLVWVSIDSVYAYRQAHVGRDRHLEIVLKPGEDKNFSLDIVPPMARKSEVVVDPALVEQNNQRKAQEDSIRNAYVSTFTDNSRGNKAVIDAFLGQLDDKDKKRGEALLQHLSAKDLTDVSLDVLIDAMSVKTQDDDFYYEYVLNPRVSNEFLVPFRKNFNAALISELKTGFRENPLYWARWVLNNITADAEWQPASVRMSPWSVWNLRRTDEASRDIFFVVGARAMGIPARIDEVTGKAQYHHGGQWKDLLSEKEDEATASVGRVKLEYARDGKIADPAYYTHFTLSKIVDGKPQLLNYPEDATYASVFAKEQTLDAGEYMLVTGQRLANGDVMCNVSFYDVKPGQTTRVPLRLRQDNDKVEVIGAFNSETLYHDKKTGEDKSLLSTTGRGYYVLGIVKNNDEPSNHALRDLIEVSAELEASGMPIVLLYPTPDEAEDSQFAEGLAFATIGSDIGGAAHSQIAQALDIKGTMPVFIIADTFNRIVFANEGYTIGIGRQLLNVIGKLQPKE